MRSDLLLGEQVPPPGDQRRNEDVEQDCFAVEQMRFVPRLQPVAERMPEIHLARQFLLEQVRLQFFQHSRDGAVENDAALLVLEMSIHALSAIRFQQVEKLRVLDDGELDDLADSVQDVTPGQGLQKGFVEQDHLRRVERSQPVLVPVVIDPGLDPDRGIHVAHQGGRHLDVRARRADSCWRRNQPRRSAHLRRWQ